MSDTFSQSKCIGPELTDGNQKQYWMLFAASHVEKTTCVLYLLKSLLFEKRDVKLKDLKTYTNWLESENKLYLLTYKKIQRLPVSLSIFLVSL